MRKLECGVKLDSLIFIDEKIQTRREDGLGFSCVPHMRKFFTVTVTLT